MNNFFKGIALPKGVSVNTKGNRVKIDVYTRTNKYEKTLWAVHGQDLNQDWYPYQDKPKLSHTAWINMKELIRDVISYNPLTLGLGQTTELLRKVMWLLPFYKDHLADQIAYRKYILEHYMVTDNQRRVNMYNLGKAISKGCSGYCTISVQYTAWPEREGHATWKYRLPVYRCYEGSAQVYHGSYPAIPVDAHPESLNIFLWKLGFRAFMMHPTRVHEIYMKDLTVEYTPKPIEKTSVGSGDETRSIRYSQLASEWLLENCMDDGYPAIRWLGGVK